MEAEGITITPKQREEVDRQLQRTALTRRVRERLEMVKAAALGDELRRIARWSGRSVVTVERWRGRFAQGGVDALADAPRSGRPVHADAAYLAAMETALERPPKQAQAGRLGVGRLDVRAAVTLLGAADGGDVRDPTEALR